MLREEGPHEPSLQSSSDESIELVNRNHSRFRRRLEMRWQCQIPGHTRCFTQTDGTHEPLGDEAMELWVSALHNGEATLLIPPHELLSSTARRDSDDVSIRSSSTIQYQRPFRWQANPSLTDLRSMRVRLRNSISSSLTSVLSTSTGSSGVPGIGYLSGKGVKWIRLQLLDAVEPLVISSRRRTIRGLIKELEKIPDQDRSKWIIKRERTISRVVEDLLELSTEEYESNYRAIAINDGVILRDLFTKTFRVPNSQEEIFICSTLVKLFPLRLLSDNNFTSGDLAGDLREILLQDSSEGIDERPLIAEVAARLCHELACGTPSSWRVDGYSTLYYVYGTSYGKLSLQDLGRSGPLIGDLVVATFTNAAQLSIREHTSAVRFLATYANDAPEYRTHLLSSAGIPLSVKHVKSLHPKFDGADVELKILLLCGVFAEISRFDWCFPMLVQCDICPTLVALLIFYQNDLNESTSKVVYQLVRIFQHLAVSGGNGGRQAVHDATTDDLRLILPHISYGVGRFLGDKLATDTQTWIAQTWVLAFETNSMIMEPY